MSEVLSYGMVGGGLDGFIGAAHRRAVNLDGEARLTAGVFSGNQEKSKAAAEAFHIDPKRCYESYQEMAKAEAQREDGIDFVVIVTPNYLHYEMCRAFLEAGIHVACDKPVTISFEQADKLQKLAEEKQLLLMVTYTYMGHVTIKHIQKKIRKGELGEIRMVMAEYPQGWLAFEDDFGGKQGAWRCDPKKTGRVNCLGDLGTHVENLAAMTTGLKIKRVLAKMDVIVPGRVLDDNDSILVEYDNGASGIYWTSQAAIGSDNALKLRIYGSRGTILWDQEESEKITEIHADGSIVKLHRGYSSIDPEAGKYARLPAGHTEGWLEAMANLYQSFICCIRAKKEGSFSEDMIDFPDISHGKEGLAFVEACLKSNENGNVWVDLQEEK
ncbi:Glucose--fructose oxidoreductase precursor [uncultured Roseburia sp.]|uniref:Gfo/Idh/MocA family oxidoreductase n=1 Tax=Brotonthovivens ammoniilytica TaxID=2981725 RepID=A0ABT2TPQ1_9FIRM|nr:Gfo/Idh/MocA family oxidoreductase [Brotonthovivens ammoniilytica]MCU6763439.1 Gfo/Idh/MocA family oxidoreductase [Brotonthovivens ammoniilytica]SCJ19266.1 Glucose--fructose oxidoreductase precursor [uncultured Roseburia sp.]